MGLPSFKLEEYFSEHEFTAPHLFCVSDAEPFSMNEILQLADTECRALWDRLGLGYTESRGMPLLREEIAAQYHSIDSTHVLCHCGAQEAIYCVMRSLLKKGDHVIVITPCYQSLKELPEVITGNVTLIGLDAEKGWELDIEQLQNSIVPETKMIVMNYPHNPTGALLSKTSFDAVIDIARARGVYLVCDEVYRLLEVDENSRLPAVADAYEKGISINVLTKAYGLGGLRVGWIASQETKVISKVSSYKNYTSICNAGPSEVLALIALRSSDALLSRNRAIVLENLELLDPFFEKYQTLFSWCRPKSGPIGFVKYQGDVERLTREVLSDAGILLLPSSVYGYPANYFRIGFGRKNFSEVLTLFTSWVDQHLI